MSLRDLDILFAEKVLGKTVVETDECAGPDNYWIEPYRGGDLHDTPLDEFHASLDAVWQGVEKLKESRWQVMLDTFQDGYRTTFWRYENIDDHAQAVGDPAVSVLKGCLLVVGITQDEIKAAEEK